MALGDDLRRIEAALGRAGEVLRRFTPGKVEQRFKRGGESVTDADTEVDDALRSSLQARGEGWLSEETADNPERLDCERVWIVDPIDGTKAFVAGVSEWCVSVALVVGERPVAGGILIPPLAQTIVGGPGVGVTVNGVNVSPRSVERLDEAQVLASRTEWGLGEWTRFAAAPFRVRPLGSIAYKLALVATGTADATWTLTPKHEWDVAAGAALVLAAGGQVWTPDGAPPRFNRRDPRLSGFCAATAAIASRVREYLGHGQVA